MAFGGLSGQYRPCRDRNYQKFSEFEKKIIFDFYHPRGGATHPHISAQGGRIKNRPDDTK